MWNCVLQLAVNQFLCRNAAGLMFFRACAWFMRAFPRPAGSSAPACWPPADGAQKNSRESHDCLLPSGGLPSWNY